MGELKTNSGVSVARKKVTSQNHPLRLSHQNESLRYSISARFKSLSTERVSDNSFKEESPFTTKVRLSLGAVWPLQEFIWGLLFSTLHVC